MSADRFSTRHIGPDEKEIALMLDEIGCNSLEQLVDETLPCSIRMHKELQLSAAMTEKEYLDHLRRLAAKNKIYKTYIGMGYYDCIIPPVIQRNILENPGWYTAYTPYQAEISQGRLEALLNFQTMITSLTAMEIANASLLDEATASAEGMIMLYNIQSKNREKSTALRFFVSEQALPQTIDVLKQRSAPLGIELIVGNHEAFDFADDIYGAFIQYPAANGEVYDYRSFTKKAKDKGILIMVAADLLSLTLLAPPGEWGADVAVGSTQRFGIPIGYGGPHAAYFATKEQYVRSMPGRVIGVSVDAMGNKALRMTLQTREQHIKREKATSNICTSQVLLAVMAGMYAVYHGPEGLKTISTQINKLTKMLSDGLNKAGFQQENERFFDTLSIRMPDIASLEKIKKRALKAGINFRYNDKTICISLDETTTPEDVTGILGIFSDTSGNLKATGPIPTGSCREAIGALTRTSSFLTHTVFNNRRSETNMMRYIKKLENKDLSLTHSMIALGSCTMKLNAASELMPLSWTEFGRLHPFVPVEQAAGFHEVIRELEDYLCKITGFDAISFQPNSGAQGEYAGLMVIREYHKSMGEEHRNVVLIPSSAHGTNPASAVMAGMKVIVVKCDSNGNIDLIDLGQKGLEHKENLAALMVTYPSTHGVFEEAIVEITSMIHKYGGQVYMDGANLNAQIGLTNPKLIGADVCHINLHKTFAIPHGGGGPGMGPIGVAAHLTPFLPSHTMVKTGGGKAMHAISAAPYGSALILLISYGYIKMLGAKGLTKATKIAVLNANYIAARLQRHYPVLYKGKKGRVAHEMIIDCREFKRTAKIEVEDIAKRLVDYGFHAPTVSFPVPGTMMIEPTESESKEEIDRFCDALISIKNEIMEIEQGKADPQNNVLKNAPHTSALVTSDKWDFPYSRKKAGYPAGWLETGKYWSPVSRIDNAYGDRNIVCNCPQTEEYSSEEILNR